MPPVANDDNLVPGQTYTFTFKLENWFSQPQPAILLADIDKQMPNFVTYASASWEANVNPFTNYLDVTFTYNGDGSDVAQDVWSAFIAAFLAGSDDSFSFSSATTGTTPAAGGGVTAQSVVQSAGQAISSATYQVTSAASKGAQNLLTPVEIAVVLVVALAAVLIFTMGKSGGLEAGPGGFRVGG